MLYSEFIAGTGCRQNEHNFKVYQNLEVMYMNSDMSKAEIYEYGKKLVDNSKSEEQLKLEKEIKEEISFYESEIARFNMEIAWAKSVLQECKEQGNDDLAWFRKNDIKYYTRQKKEARNRIKTLKFALEW